MPDSSECFPVLRTWTRLLDLCFTQKEMEAQRGDRWPGIAHLVTGLAEIWTLCPEPVPSPVRLYCRGEALSQPHSLSGTFWWSAVFLGSTGDRVTSWARGRAWGSSCFPTRILLFWLKSETELGPQAVCLDLCYLLQT